MAYCLPYTPVRGPAPLRSGMVELACLCPGEMSKPTSGNLGDSLQQCSVQPRSGLQSSRRDSGSSPTPAGRGHASSWITQLRPWEGFVF